jgi:hypothetical protein
LWDNAHVQRTPQEWALRWVWNHPEVTLALSGMSKMEQVIENIAAAEYSQPHNLTAADLALIEKVHDTFLALSTVACTGCRDCMPCQYGVNITRIFDLYNEAIIYNTAAENRKSYNSMRPAERADKCNKCGECLAFCTNKVNIPASLEEAHRFFTE